MLLQQYNRLLLGEADYLNQTSNRDEEKVVERCVSMAALISSLLALGIAPPASKDVTKGRLMLLNSLVFH
jgi:hypothetical protein